MIGEMVPQFWKLISSMLKDIKKYVVKGRMDSASIYPLPINDYPQNTINKRDLYNAVYNIHQQNDPGDFDASQMIKNLFDWKDEDARWIVKPRIESISRRPTSILWMSLSQIDLYSRFSDVVILDTTANTIVFK